MTNKKNTIAGIMAALMLFAVSSAMATRKKVFFYHKTDKILKMDCVEIKSKHDAFPSYRCYDDEGNSQPIKPGTDWELVKVEEVCFRHQVRDTIRTCVEITGQSNTPSSYACFNNKEPHPFQPTTKWKKIEANDSRCAPHFMPLDDVPRIIVFPTLPQWSDKDGTKK